MPKFAVTMKINILLISNTTNMKVTNIPTCINPRGSNIYLQSKEQALAN